MSPSLLFLNILSNLENNKKSMTRPSPKFHIKLIAAAVAMAVMLTSATIGHCERSEAISITENTPSFALAPGSRFKAAELAGPSSVHHVQNSPFAIDGESVEAVLKRGMPPMGDLLEILKKEETPFLLAKLGDLVFGFLLREEERIKYMRRVMKGPPLSEAEKEKIEKDVRSGGAVLYGPTLVLAASELGVSPEAFSRRCGIPWFSERAVVVNGLHADYHRSVFEEVLHVLEGWHIPDPVTWDTPREVINDLIQLLFFSEDKTSLFWSSYTDWSSEEKAALRRRYTEEAKLNPNTRLRLIICRILGELEGGAEIQIGKKKEPLLRVLFKKQLFQVRRSEGKRSLALRLEGATIEYLNNLLDKEQFSKYDVLFPNWMPEGRLRKAISAKEPDKLTAEDIEGMAWEVYLTKGRLPEGDEISAGLGISERDLDGAVKKLNNLREASRLRKVRLPLHGRVLYNAASVALKREMDTPAFRVAWDLFEGKGSHGVWEQSSRFQDAFLRLRITRYFERVAKSQRGVMPEWARSERAYTILGVVKTMGFDFILKNFPAQAEYLIASLREKDFVDPQRIRVKFALKPHLYGGHRKIAARAFPELRLNKQLERLRSLRTGLLAPGTRFAAGRSTKFEEDLRYNRDSRKALEFLRSLGIRKGSSLINVGDSICHELAIAAAHLGATYIAYDLTDISSINYWIEEMGVDSMEGTAQIIQGEFSSGLRSASQDIPNRSQDVVLILTGALSDPYPESNAEEVLREALRVVKNKGKIVIGSVGLWVDIHGLVIAEKFEAEKLIKMMLEKPEYKGKVRLIKRQRVEYEDMTGDIYEVEFIMPDQPAANQLETLAATDLRRAP